MTAALETILALLRRLKLDLSDEKRAQAEISAAFFGAGIGHAREVRLSASDRIDFLVDGAGIGIEVKLKGNARAAVLRQLARYAGHDRVRELILVTNLSMGLPAAIGGKPAYYVSMGRAWMG